MTLNSLKKELVSLLENHKLIRSVYFGEPQDWTSQTLTYPAACISLRDSVRVVPAGLEFDFSVWLVDLTDTEEGNIIEVQSDCIEIANDIASDVDDPSQDWIVRGDINISVYSASPINDDITAGVEMTFSLFIEKQRDRCQVPKNNEWVLDENGNPILDENGNPLTT
jgi:hypothetical protein